MSFFGQPGSGGGFGTAAAPPAQPPPFGAPQPSPFGAPAAAPAASPFGAPAPAPAGGQFGAPAAASAPALAGLGAGFGAPAAAPAFGAAPAATGGGLFGGGFGAAAAQSSGFSFGQPAAVAPAAATGFGATAGGLFGQPPQAASLFQSPPQQPQQQQLQQQLPQQQQVPQPPPGTTRVSQLPPQAVQMLEAGERLLTDQRSKAARLFALQPGAEGNVVALRERCAATRRRLVCADTGVEALACNANALRNAVREDRRAADGLSHSLTQLSRSLQAEDGSQPSSAYAYGGGDAMAPVPSIVTHVSPEYLASVVDDLEERANGYKREIDQIAEFLCADGGSGTGGVAAVSGLDALHARYQAGAAGPGPHGADAHRRRGGGGGDRRAAGAPTESRGRAIEDIIRRQYEYFMVVANNVAAVHEALAQLKSDFVADARWHDADAVDPFAQADARERAEEERKRRAAAAVQVGDKDGTAPVPQALGPAAAPPAAAQAGPGFGGFGGFGPALGGAAATAAKTPGLPGAPLGTGGGLGAPVAAAATPAFGGFSTSGFGAAVAAGGEGQSRRPSGSSRRNFRRT